MPHKVYGVIEGVVRRGVVRTGSGRSLLHLSLELSIEPPEGESIRVSVPVFVIPEDAADYFVGRVCWLAMMPQDTIEEIDDPVAQATAQLRATLAGPVPESKSPNAFFDNTIDYSKPLQPITPAEWEAADRMVKEQATGPRCSHGGRRDLCASCAAETMIPGVLSR